MSSLFVFKRKITHLNILRESVSANVLSILSLSGCAVSAFQQDSKFESKSTCSSPRWSTALSLNSTEIPHKLQWFRFAGLRRLRQVPLFYKVQTIGRCKLLPTHTSSNYTAVNKRERHRAVWVCLLLGGLLWLSGKAHDRSQIK